MPMSTTNTKKLVSRVCYVYCKVFSFTYQRFINKNIESDAEYQEAEKVNSAHDLARQMETKSQSSQKYPRSTNNIESDANAAECQETGELKGWLCLSTRLFKFYLSESEIHKRKYRIRCLI